MIKPKTNHLNIENQMCHPAYSMVNALNRLYKHLLNPLELTYPQYLIMMVLWEQDGINMNAVSEKTYFDSGTLTPLMNKLNKKGFIHIEVDKLDRRNKNLYLTHKGTKLKSLASEIPKKLASLIPLTKDESHSFIRMTQLIHKAIILEENRLK